MAQTGYTPISIYYSATATNTPTAGNLVAGELAINTADGKLFYKDSSGVVQVLGTKGGVGSSSTTQVLYNSSGLVVGSANMTFSGTALTLANDASISGLTVGKGTNGVTANTALGSGALLGANSGSGNNTAIGYQSSYSNTSGSYNTSVGQGSLYTNTTGILNVALGQSSLYYNTTGGYNVAVGPSALFSNTTASNNTAVGYQAGYNLTTGTGNLYVGYATSASATGVNYEIVVGVGGVTGKGTQTGYFNPAGGGVYQGNNSTLWSITSDQRLKKNIVDNNDGLDKITQIKVRNFEYRTADEITELEPQNAIDIKGVQLGAIAQELQAVLPNCVKTESTGVMSVDASNLTWYLINAVKELNAKVEALEAQLQGK